MVIDKKEFKYIFEQAKSRYGELQHVHIDLRFNSGLFFTMRAGIVLSSVFNKKRKYFINVNPRKKDILSKLSQDDIIGWLGHELVHVVDYETMSSSSLAVFALRYIFNLKFRFSVEKRINAYTFNNGFAKELFGVWRKFLSLNSVDKRYKEYITKNYRPDWSNVQESAMSQGISKEFFESFK